FRRGARGHAMPDIGTKLRNTSFKELLSVRARLVVLALILVVPFMADRVRVLERARAISLQLLNSARQSAEAQREMVSSIEALLKSVAYSTSLGASSGRVCTM